MLAEKQLLSAVFWCHVCVSTAQPQLPRGETALWVPAQQVGPHQAAHRRFWPAQISDLVLRAKSTRSPTSSLSSIENGVSNQEGALLFINPPRQLLPLQQPSSSLLHPFPILYLHSLLFSFNSKGFVVAWDLENLTLTFTPRLLLFFLIIFPQWAPVEFHTTGLVEGATWGVKGFGENSSNLLKDFIWQKKKEQKKVFLSIRENINMYLSKQNKMEIYLFWDS